MNTRRMPTLHLPTLHLKQGLCLGLLSWWAWACWAQPVAQTQQSAYTGKPPVPVAGEQALSAAELKARYQHCELGHYQGPRPGKSRYVKDRYIWAVTPEFAQKFCMPPEFVSHELKGAQAVAFKLVPGGFGENCGFGGKTETCGQGVDTRFEIYIQRSVKLPVKNEVDFYIWTKDTSVGLLGYSASTEKYQTQRHKTNPVPGWIPRFELDAFGLSGIQGNKVVWPITTLRLHEYRGKLYDASLDFIALQGMSGEFRNRRMLKEDIRDFVIVMRSLGDRENSDGRQMKEFAHVIHLPRAFSAQVQAMDLGEGDDWGEFARKALQGAQVK